MAARTCKLYSDLSAADVNVRVVDYRWDTGERISNRDNNFILCYRPAPTGVSIQANLENGTLQSFGQLMFFPAHTEVRTTAARSRERTKNVVCTLGYDWFNQVWPTRSRWTLDDLARCYDLKNFRIEQAMQRLACEAANPGFASLIMVESMARLIAVEVARHFQNGPTAHRVRTADGQFSTAELGRIYDFIDSVTNHCPTTAEISQSCGVSSAHLRRAFKQTTGQTLHQYVANARLKKAQTILAETDLPLKDVAYRLGFASSSTFSSTFKRVSGEKPSAYRQRQQRYA